MSDRLYHFQVYGTLFGLPTRQLCRISRLQGVHQVPAWLLSTSNSCFVESSATTATSLALLQAHYLCARSCLPCPPGSFAGTLGQGFCDPCPPGSSTNVTGTPRCPACALGTFSQYYGAVTCNVCPAGMVAPKVMSSFFYSLPCDRQTTKFGFCADRVTILHRVREEHLQRPTGHHVVHKVPRVYIVVNVWRRVAICMYLHVR